MRGNPLHRRSAPTFRMPHIFNRLHIVLLVLCIFILVVFGWSSAFVELRIDGFANVMDCDVLAYRSAYMPQVSGATNICAFNVSCRTDLGSYNQNTFWQYLANHSGLHHAYNVTYCKVQNQDCAAVSASNSTVWLRGYTQPNYCGFSNTTLDSYVLDPFSEYINQWLYVLSIFLFGIGFAYFLYRFRPSLEKLDIFDTTIHPEHILHYLAQFQLGLLGNLNPAVEPLLRPDIDCGTEEVWIRPDGHRDVNVRPMHTFRESKQSFFLLLSNVIIGALLIGSCVSVVTLASAAIRRFGDHTYGIYGDDDYSLISVHTYGKTFLEFCSTAFIMLAIIGMEDVFFYSHDWLMARIQLAVNTRGGSGSDNHYVAYFEHVERLNNSTSERKHRFHNRVFIPLLCLLVLRDIIVFFDDNYGLFPHSIRYVLHWALVFFLTILFTTVICYFYAKSHTASRNTIFVWLNTHPQDEYELLDPEVAEHLAATIGPSQDFTETEDEDEPSDDLTDAFMLPGEGTVAQPSHTEVLSGRGSAIRMHAVSSKALDHRIPSVRSGDAIRRQTTAELSQEVLREQELSSVQHVDLNSPGTEVVLVTLDGDRTTRVIHSDETDSFVQTIQQQIGAMKEEGAMLESTANGHLILRRRDETDSDSSGAGPAIRPNESTAPAMRIMNNFLALAKRGALSAAHSFEDDDDLWDDDDDDIEPDLFTDTEDMPPVGMGVLPSFNVPSQVSLDSAGRAVSPQVRMVSHMATKPTTRALKMLLLIVCVILQILLNCAMVGYTWTCSLAESAMHGSLEDVFAEESLFVESAVIRDGNAYSHLLFGFLRRRAYMSCSPFAKIGIFSIILPLINAAFDLILYRLARSTSKIYADEDDHAISACYPLCTILSQYVVSAVAVLGCLFNEEHGLLYYIINQAVTEGVLILTPMVSEYLSSTVRLNVMAVCRLKHSLFRYSVLFSLPSVFYYLSQGAYYWGSFRVQWTHYPYLLSFLIPALIVSFCWDCFATYLMVKRFNLSPSPIFLALKQPILFSVTLATVLMITQFTSVFDMVMTDGIPGRAFHF